MTGTRTLGTLLRTLIETLDGAVEDAYRREGLKGYKPRYTPVVRALQANGPSTIKTIAEKAGISHSAASQTVAQMTRAGLVKASVGKDARERIIALSVKARNMLPRLEQQWAATEAAGRTVDEELGRSLPGEIEKVLALLERRSFSDRIKEASARQRESKKAPDRNLKG